MKILREKKDSVLIKYVDDLNVVQEILLLETDDARDAQITSPYQAVEQVANSALLQERIKFALP